MKLMYKPNIFVGVILAMAIVFIHSPAYSGYDSQVLTRAREAAKTGQVDFAFLQYHFLLNKFPSSPYKEQALFANAEYYFFMSDYSQAEKLFQQYFEASNDKNGKFFALAYLFKIAQVTHEKGLIKNWERQIIAYRPHRFLFSRVKEYKFLSPLQRRHKAVYDINKVEIFIGEERFAQIIF